MSCYLMTFHVMSHHVIKRLVEYQGHSAAVTSLVMANDDQQTSSLPLPPPIDLTRTSPLSLPPPIGLTQTRPLTHCAPSKFREE